jgi:hypothetical protein
MRSYSFFYATVLTACPYAQANVCTVVSFRQAPVATPAAAHSTLPTARTAFVISAASASQ